MKTGIKPYPCCRLAHAAIDLAIKLREQVPEADRANAKLTVEINAVAYELVGGTEEFKRSPRSTVDAQFSVFFVTAAGWLDGKVDWDSYTKLKDPALLNVTKNMTVNMNKDLPDGGATLSVEAGGKKLSDRLDVPSGEPSNWMGDGALKAKFMNEAGKVFGKERTEEIFDAVFSLDADSSVPDLIRMTRTHKD